MVDLLRIGLPELVEGLEVFCIACPGAKLLSGHGVHAVKEGQLEYLGQVEIPLEDIGLIAESPGLHAAGAAALPRVLQRFPGIQQLLDDGLRVVEGGLPPALAGDFAGPLQEPAGILAADLDIGVWLD